MAEEGAKRAVASEDIWLHAWKDQLAGVKAVSSCLELADVTGDGDCKLLVADAQKQLKVFSGTHLVSANPLLDTPVAIVSFFMDYKDEVRRPNIAVASGPYIFMYKNLRPYYKFTLPPIDLSPVELEVWNKLRMEQLSVGSAVDQLEGAKDNGVMLSTRSQDLLALETPDERDTFVHEHRETPLVQMTVITAMAVLNKDKDEPGSLGCLVVGTESARLLILDSVGATVTKRIQLAAVPVMIHCSGLHDVEYRIIVSCRNGNVYIIKNGELLGVTIEVDSQPVSMCRVENSIVVATMTNVVYFYHMKGKRQFSLTMPCSITNMCALWMESIRQPKAVIIALSNGEIRLYNGKNLVSKTVMQDTVTAMKFGRYGREDGTLVMAMKSGAIVIKMLPRTANIDPAKSLSAGPPPEQDIPLKVPKTTKLHIEQTQREKEFGVDMHRVFQRDLCKLRLQTARAYVKILTDGQGPMSFTAGSSLRLTAHVQGLGPVFKIKLNIQNTGAKALTGIPVVFTYNREIYKMSSPMLSIPALVPSLVYNFEIDVSCVDEEAQASDAIRVYVCSATSSVPIITALINMPIPEFLMN